MSEAAVLAPFCGRFGWAEGRSVEPNFEAESSRGGDTGGWQLSSVGLAAFGLNITCVHCRGHRVIRGPGIAAGSTFTLPASNVDVAPTLLGLAGADLLAQHMDGRSIVPMIVDPADPAVMPSTRAHIARELAKLARPDARGKIAGVVGRPSSSTAPIGPVASGVGDGDGGIATVTGVASMAKAQSAWRTFHPIEFISLNNHTWFGHLVDDVKSNTYRGLRFVNDPTYGELLYAEFTAVTDWEFEAPCHYELFNMTTDPVCLDNIYYTTATVEVKADLQKRLLTHWGCSGATCA